AVQREGAEAAVADLLLDLPARADEDRRRARLVDGHARARDLRLLGAAELEQLAGGVDDRDDHAVSLPGGELEPGAHDRVGARGVDHPLGPDGCHEPHAPFASSTAAKIAVSVVMNRTSRRGPPNVKFTVPGRWISSSSAPSAAWMRTPADAEA